MYESIQVGEYKREVLSVKPKWQSNRPAWRARRTACDPAVGMCNRLKAVSATKTWLFTMLGMIGLAVLVMCIRKLL